MLEHDVSTQNISCKSVTISLLASMLHVAMLARSLLLPQACAIFLRKCGAAVPGGEGQWGTIWLIVCLHSYMRYKCIHRKFGVLLYRNGGDLLKSLPWVLIGSKCHTHSTENHHKHNFTHQNCTEERKRWSNKQPQSSTIYFLRG